MICDCQGFGRQGGVSRWTVCQGFFMAVKLFSMTLRLWTHSTHVIVRACCLFNRVQFFTTLWTVARQAPLSVGFSRQEYWSRLPCPPPGGLPNPGIKPMPLASLALAGSSLPLVPPGNPRDCYVCIQSIQHPTLRVNPNVNYKL